MPQDHASILRGQPIENPLRFRPTAVVNHDEITESKAREAFHSFEKTRAGIECGDQNHYLGNADYVHRSRMLESTSWHDGNSFAI